MVDPPREYFSIKTLTERRSRGWENFGNTLFSLVTLLGPRICISIQKEWNTSQDSSNNVQNIVVALPLIIQAIGQNEIVTHIHENVFFFFNCSHKRLYFSCLFTIHILEVHRWDVYGLYTYSHQHHEI